MRKLLKITTSFALALLLTAGVAFGQSNDTDIDQLTSNNTATVDQDGEGLKATVVQKGDNKNYASISQNTDVAGMVESTIRQVGFNNRAITRASRKNSVSSTTLQKQIGNRNRAFINQDAGNDPAGNEGKLLTQTQLGNQNLARMSGSNDYSGEQYQEGSNNVAKASGLSKNANLYQFQKGDENRAVNDANNLNHADSDQIQKGSYNRSVLKGISGVSGFSEDYDVRQLGSHNEADLTANGHGGVLGIKQDGSQNTANVTWNSNMNTTDIFQDGFGNTATVNSGTN